ASAFLQDEEKTTLEQVRDILAGRVYGKETQLRAALADVLSSPYPVRGKFENSTDEQLLAVLAKELDVDAHTVFKEVWKRYHSRLIAAVRRWSLVDTVDAEDIVQDTFLTFFEAIKANKLRPEDIVVHKLARQLLDIARSKCMAAVRNS